MATIYLAGGLFNAGERLHNLLLERYLKVLGHEVILPQREALKFFEDGKLDIQSVVDDCEKHAVNPANICVVNSGDPDADSGSCVEYGMAVATTGKAIVYRTDFRTEPEKEVGVNAMLRSSKYFFIYQPCFFTSFSEVRPYYKELARKISEAIDTVNSISWGDELSKEQLQVISSYALLTSYNSEEFMHLVKAMSYNAQKELYRRVYIDLKNKQSLVDPEVLKYGLSVILEISGKDEEYFEEHI